jgi:hypothetical protein
MLSKELFAMSSRPDAVLSVINSLKKEVNREQKTQIDQIDRRQPGSGKRR